MGEKTSPVDPDSLRKRRGTPFWHPRGLKVMNSVRLPEIRFLEHKLANGLQVILYRDNQVPLVHITLHYRVGSSYEKPGLSGLAHLFEHMMFQGSRNVGKNEHGRHVDSAGGRWNASTSKDRTNYYETLPSHFLELGLWLEADRMHSLNITEENFENQRQTVIEEKKQSYDNRPYGLAYLRFDELAYQNWAYAHPIIGSVEDLQAASLEDALEFHRSFYGPGNAVLVLSGNLQEEEALQAVTRYFGSIPDETSVRTPDLSEPEQEEEKFEVISDPLAALPAVSVGYHMPPFGSREYYSLSVLSMILGWGDSSRLYRKLVYEKNWITGLSVGPNQHKGPELFMLWFQVQAGAQVGTVLNTVEEELDRIGQEGVRPRELEKARNQITHRFVSRFATVSRIGELLARCVLFYEDPGVINRELELFLSVSAEEIRETAQRVFRRENRVVIVVEPTS